MDFLRAIAFLAGAGLVILPLIVWFKRMTILRRALLSGAFIISVYFGFFIIVYVLDPVMLESIGWLSFVWSGCVIFAIAIVAGLGIHWRLEEGQRRWKEELSKVKGIHPKIIEIYKMFHDIEDDGD